MYRKILKSAVALFFLSALALCNSIFAAVPSAQKLRIAVYDGVRQSKNPCYAKVETYGKTDVKDWYFSVGDHQVKLGFEPEYSEIKKRSVKLDGTFKSFKLGAIHQIPNMVPSSTIAPMYAASSELILDSKQIPKAFSLVISNKNYMAEFPDKNFLCHELRLAKYWPCTKPAQDFENRGGWCMRSDIEENINF